MTGFSQNHGHVSNKPLGFVRHVALDGSRGPPPARPYRHVEAKHSGWQILDNHIVYKAAYSRFLSSTYASKPAYKQPIIANLST